MDSPRLRERARDLLSDPESQLWFSAASSWEIVIKSGLGRSDCTVDPVELRHSLLVNGYRELAVSGQHALAITELPGMHRDLLDRLLVAQATAEGYLLATVDTQLIGLPGVLDLR
jgi:PIN domain nuclease of toxin-antitoxin system